MKKDKWWVLLILTPILILLEEELGRYISETMFVWSILVPPIYTTDILAHGEEYQFDDTYKVYLTDSNYGDLKIRYEEAIECWMVQAN